MTYTQISELVRKGKIGMLPHFVGYFKWNYNKEEVWFENGDYKCPAN